MTLRLLPLLFALVFSPGLAANDRLFDAHLHYNDEHAREFTPDQILDILHQNNIVRAIVTSKPPLWAMTLHRHAPDRIVPFLGVYRHEGDKQRWHQDKSLPAFVEQQLDNGDWRGIGELHLFAENRHSEVFQQLVRLASTREIPLLMHADPAVIDTIYELEPDVTVIWAHAGTYPYPDLLANYLERYPKLMIDLSVRDERIAPDGNIQDEWYELFIRHPGRFMVGVDTFSTNRWHKYSDAIATLRDWLSQLPPDTADRLGYRNANLLFNRKIPEH